MCVRIIKGTKQFEYDQNKPLEEQIKGSSEIIVNYLDNDKSVDHFLNELEKRSMSAFSQDFKVRVIHNNLINGANAMKKVSYATSAVNINNLIQMMVLSHCETEKKIDEIVSFINKDCNE